MELTDKEIHLLAWLSRDRGLCAECNGADLDALQKLDLLQWFDARSSTTPFKQDLRLFLKLHGVGSRIDYAWVAAVENWRELVGQGFALPPASGASHVSTMQTAQRVILVVRLAAPR
jgi:hypothetical protein